MNRRERHPEDDLDAIFYTNSVDFTAQHVFVNRDTEQQAFDRAYENHALAIRRRSFDCQDVVAPRNNVLAFHSTGGIGKSMLSERLQDRLHKESAYVSDWSPFEANQSDIATARIDLSRDFGLDLETVLMLVRVALVRFDKPMYAFDLALGRYWAKVHPEEDLQQYVRRNSAFRRTSESLGLPGQIAETIVEVLGGVAGLSGAASMLTRGTGELLQYIKSKAGGRRALASCRRLQSVLEARINVESLSYYPHLLSWDLSQLQEQRDVQLVVFFDTFEEATNQDDRSFERFLQRLVWLMPNVLFVTTGRNRLEWAEFTLRDQLGWTGPVSWPGLAAGATQEPRQHLLGFLSSQDADKFLQGRLITPTGPMIPAEMRSRIVEASQGMPLHLDLSVTRFLQVNSKGRELVVSEFDDDFPALVARIMRDLTPDERTVLRAVSLLEGFDIDLAAATAGLSRNSPAVALSKKAFVQHDPTALWPFRIHAAIAEQVRSADRGLADSWSARDWREGASRAFSHLGAQARDAHQSGERRGMIACLNEGLRLCHEFLLPLSWVVEAAYWFIEDSLWEQQIRLPASASDDLGAPSQLSSSAVALSLVLLAAVQRQTQRREDVLAKLSRCIESGLLDGDALALARYFHAETLRNLGREEESRVGMLALARTQSRISDQATKGLCHLDRREGKFRSVLSILDERPRTGMWLRLRGDLWWTQARFDEAQSAYAESRDWLNVHGKRGDAAESAACLAFAAAFSHPGRAYRLIEEAREAMIGVNIYWAELQLQLAEALALAGDKSGETERLCASVAERARTNGLTSSEVYAQMVRCFDAATLGDEELLVRRRTDATRLVRGNAFHYIVEIIDFLAGRRSEDVHAQTSDWIDGVRATGSRWLDAVGRRAIINGRTVE